MLAAALHLVQVLGPHAVELNEQIRQTDNVSSPTKAPGLRHSTPTASDDIKDVLADYTTTGTPLPMIEDHDIDRRLTSRVATDDPLLPVATGVLARQAGYSPALDTLDEPQLREPLTDAVDAVGVEKIFGRNAIAAPAADGSDDMLPWTLPLHRSQAVALVGVVRTAAIIILAATSGMRSSELMELRVGCRRPVEEPIPGLKRYRIASKIVKGQASGGTDDEWVVIEPVLPRHRTRRATPRRPPRRGSAVRPVRLLTFATSGSATGSTPRPEPVSDWLRFRDEPVTLRMLRRTLSLEMAYRPGGVLAAKIHLKHCRRRDHRRLCLTPRRRSGRTAC